MLFCKSCRAVVCYTAVWKERCVTTLKLSRHARPLPIQETAQPWVLVSKETFVWEAMGHATVLDFVSEERNFLSKKS